MPTADETGSQTKSLLEYGVKDLKIYKCEKLNDIRGFQDLNCRSLKLLGLEHS